MVSAKVAVHRCDGTEVDWDSLIGGIQSDGLTDTELRASPVPVSGTVTATGTQTDALTDTELRASPVPVNDHGNLTYATPSRVTVGSTSTALVASSTDDRREVLVKVPAAAVGGVHLNANGAATTSHFLLEPGQGVILTTAQAVAAIRAAAVDVVVDVLTGAL